MPKRYNIKIIKHRHSYDLKEIAQLLGKGKRTCFRWIDEGLKVIDPDSKPLLVMGVELIRFLKEKQAKNKTSLKDDEYYCCHCKKPTRAKTGSEATRCTGKKIGKDNREQIIKTGLCEVCNTKINRLC